VITDAPMTSTTVLQIIFLLGSMASLLGIPIALVGILQARNAARKSEAESKASKEASVQAKQEVEQFRKELQLVSNVIDFEKALALMDDIKSFIRHSNFGPVPDKIAGLIALLNTVRSPSMEIGTDAESAIQSSVVALRRIEDAIHRSWLAEDKPKGVENFNKTISRQIDVLQPILIDLRNQIGDRHE
jgi:hypothetical protein